MGNGSAFVTDDRSGGYATTAMWQHAGEVTLPRKTAVHAVQQGQRVIYAMRLPDGIIKIGCCSDLANRASQLHGKILGFRPGDLAEELEVHRSLRRHVARGREFYHPRPEVIAFVNELRDLFDLPHIAA
jgi:hypothetical protein